MYVKRFKNLCSSLCICVYVYVCECTVIYVYYCYLCFGDLESTCFVNKVQLYLKIKFQMFQKFLIDKFKLKPLGVCNSLNRWYFLFINWTSILRTIYFISLSIHLKNVNHSFTFTHEIKKPLFFFIFNAYLEYTGV